MRLFSLLCLVVVLLPAHGAGPLPIGSLVIVGGGKMPDEVRSRFVELAGGKAARIVVIPTASASADGPDAAKIYLKAWQPLANSVELLHTRQRKQADDPAFARPLAQATGVWISGGDQSRLTAAYGGTLIERELQRIVRQGGVVGGTSAGAAVMSKTMIARGSRTAELAPGLGLAEGLLIDQHFLKRDRLERLRDGLAKKPGLVGVGIDEATAAIVRGGRLEVLGESYVLLFVSDNQRQTIRVLKRGDQVKLP